MPANERLANIIREAFMDLSDVEEKKMFSGTCFMVDGKMCICVNAHEIMCRVSPEIYAEALEKNGAQAMMHGGRTMKNCVFVHEDVLKTTADFKYWIDSALAFNKIAEPSKSKAKRK
jgi:TfoX/Sxy family transcriptional regulator of competence genes